MSAGADTTPATDLVIVTCEGREHLLAATLESFDRASDYPFRKRIVAVDGQVDPQIIRAAGPDLVVQSWNRRGLVANIAGFLRQLDSEFFFWLEDDWSFARKVEVPRMIDLLSLHPVWAQVRLSKTAPLTPEERAVSLVPGVFGSAYGFSANPSLNRTALLRDAFASVLAAPRTGVLTFEPLLSEWCATHGHPCAVLDPEDRAPIAHEGYLESTARQFHTTMSLNEHIPPPHVYGMGQPPNSLQRAAMAGRLAIVFGRLAVSQCRSLKDFEFAFRVVQQARRLWS